MKKLDRVCEKICQFYSLKYQKLGNKATLKTFLMMEYFDRPYMMLLNLSIIGK